MMGVKGWIVLVGSWTLFVVGGLMIATDGLLMEHNRLIEDSMRLLVLVDGWLADAGWVVASWVDVGRSTVDGVASWLSGVGRC
jgi:hypothetical protein